MSKVCKVAVFVALGAMGLLLQPTNAHASSTPPTQPTLPTPDTTPAPVDQITPPDRIETPTVDDQSGNDSLEINAPGGTSNAVLLVLLVTVAGILPGLLLLTTTFPRFLIVLGLARQGLGLNTTPPNQVLSGLAAFLTLFVMAPTFSKINDTAIQPAMKGEITQGEAVKQAWEPMSEFMLKHTRDSDLAMLYDLTDTKRPANPSDVTPRFLIPAFILSELRAAFIIGFLIWVPFLLIDLIVSTVLASLGMLMMPPVVVSLPVKLALFVLVDGWALLAGSLLKSVA
ncbi:MAG: flagellar type III secretion system pore protein FliP [Actinomycetia bacterium]|nr:flagellar type III secretion system pore protein FliP [Actinomycetes bacterium]